MNIADDLVKAFNDGYEQGKADAMPVEHGAWVFMSDSVGEYSCCSWCGHEGFKGMNYCPNCGARMDGEKKDNEAEEEEE